MSLDDRIADWLYARSFESLGAVNEEKPMSDWMLTERVAKVEGQILSVMTLVGELQKQLTFAKDVASGLINTVQMQHDRINQLEKEVETHAAIIGPPQTNQAKADLSVISPCGEISLSEDVPLLHVIDERSLWIDEMLQLIDKKIADTTKFKDQWIDCMRSTNEHQAYVERMVLMSLRLDVAKMIGDNPILVRRQK